MLRFTKQRLSRCLGLLLVLCSATLVHGEDPWVIYPGGPGPGQDHHIVLVSGDEEYRSEEALPQLGKILSQRYGFQCTVLFAIDKTDGTINPNESSNIPGLEALKTADLLILFTRFRNLPDDQMQYLADYIESGKPIIGLRTSTHAFNNGGSPKFKKYHWQSKEFDGGFGRQVLGETWISHHGNHGSQSTRGLVADGQAEHPILRGIKSGDVWGPTDVYGVTLPLPGDSQPLVMGQILKGMKFDDEPLEGPKNDPLMPVAWVKTYTGASGKPSRVFTTTMGAATDLVTPGTRRMLVNATFWALGLEDKITPTMNVDLVGEFKPTQFSFNGYVKGLKPAVHALPSK